MAYTYLSVHVHKQRTRPERDRAYTCTHASIEQQDSNIKKNNNMNILEHVPWGGCTGACIMWPINIQTFSILKVGQFKL